MSGFEKLNEEFPSKESFYSFLTGERLNDKEYKHVERFGIHSKWNQYKIITNSSENSMFYL